MGSASRRPNELASAVAKSPGPIEAGAALAENQRRQIAQAEGLRVINRQADRAVQDADENFKPEEGYDE